MLTRAIRGADLRLKRLMGYDGVKGCTKSESNGTEGEEGKPTEGVEL
ncbi:6940_t:CDS:2 [Gigaspora rosea]|nr:6940_t:CDS:2 [Gigaspora rosea]